MSWNKEKHMMWFSDGKTKYRSTSIFSHVDKIYTLTNKQKTTLTN